MNVSASLTKSIFHCGKAGRAQRSPRVRFTTGSIPNLTRRRLCNPLERDLGCAGYCCAVSVARARAALTATFPRSIRSSPRRATSGAAKSCSFVIFMILPPAFGWSPEPHLTTQNNAPRSRPSHGRSTTLVGRGWAAGAPIVAVPGEQPDPGRVPPGHHPIAVVLGRQGSMTPELAELEAAEAAYTESH